MEFDRERHSSGGGVRTPVAVWLVDWGGCRSWFTATGQELRPAGATPVAACLTALRARTALADDAGLPVVARVYADWSRAPLDGDAAGWYDAGAEPVYVPAPAGAVAVAVQIALDAAAIGMDVPAVVLAYGGPDSDLAPLRRALARRGVLVHTLTRPVAVPPAQTGAGSAAAPPLAGPAPAPSEPLSAADRRPPAAPAPAPALTTAVSPTAGPAPTPATTAPSPAVWQFDGATFYEIEERLRELREVVLACGEPPAGELTGFDFQFEVESMRAGTDQLDTRWARFTAEQQRMLLAMSAARIKHLQAQKAAIQDPRQGHRLTQMFGALTRFSAQKTPGSVNGLARAHEPENGSWPEDARLWYGRLREVVGMTPPPADLRQQLLGTVSRTVEQWLRADPADRAGAAAQALQEQVRACFKNGIVKSDADLATLVRPAVEALKSTDFKTLRKAVKVLATPSPPMGGTSGIDGGRPSVLRLCGDDPCIRLARERYVSGMTVERVSREDCAICGGSNDRKAILTLSGALDRHEISRLVIVGGNPEKRTTLKENLERDGREVRLIDGTARSTTKEAISNLNWAQLVVVWGGTELDHSVSDQYLDNVPEGVLVATPQKRGIAALCETVVARLDGAETAATV